MMKNLLYILFSFFFLTNVNSQITVVIEDSPNGEMYYELGNSEDKKIGYSVVNETDVEHEWFWTVEPVDFPDGWSFQVCDTKGCYDFGVAMNPSSRPNASQPGTLTVYGDTYVNVQSNGIDGSAFVDFKIYDDAERTNPIFESSIPTSTKNVDFTDLKVFPNPTSDYFSINDDNNVKSIVLYNIVGKEIRSFNHTTGMEHDVKDLRNGMYLLRLMDADNKVLKTMRLSKR